MLLLCVLSRKRVQYFRVFALIIRLWIVKWIVMNNPLEWAANLLVNIQKPVFSNCIFQLSPLFTATLQNAQLALRRKRIHICSLAFCIAFAGQNEHLAKWGEVSVHLVTSQRAEWVLNTQFMKSGASKRDEQWTEIISGGSSLPGPFSIPASSCTHLVPFAVQY